MYNIIAALLLNLASLMAMPVAVDETAGAGACTVICSLPVDGASAE